MAGNLSFTPIEETISFYTRNDFAIMNHLLVGDFDGLWKYALIAYEDNRAVLEEYEKGERSVDGDYDIKWQNSLKKRLLPNGLDDAAKKTVIQNAKSDIANILDALYPAKEDMLLYRTAWLDREYAAENRYPYSREYKAIPFEVGSVLNIEILSSFSMTPYREDEDVGSDFYRYELRALRGTPILELDTFATHNEAGEVLLPPMQCLVIRIRKGDPSPCMGIIELEFIKPLNPKGNESI